MPSVAFVKGTKTEIENTPKIDGQVLIETDQGDLNKIYTDTLDTSVTPNVVERTLAGGGGHLIVPSPKSEDPTPTEGRVVRAINEEGADPRTDRINSIYGTQRWSNESTKRYIVDGSGGKIGSSGIGTFPDEEAEVVEAEPTGLEDPSALGWYELDTATHQYVRSEDTLVDMSKRYFESIINESDWIYLDILTTIEHIPDPTNPDDSGMGADNIGVQLKFDPKTNEPIILGGYVIDTDTGNMCIKFGNSISDTEHARVAIDLTYTRNDISYIV